MVRRIVLFLFMLAGIQQIGMAAMHDEWQPVSGAKAVAFVEKFYSFMSMETGRWDDTVLEQYLAPSVLKCIADSASSDGQKYASWLLSATDDSEMIKPSVQSKAPVVADDGRIAKDLTVFYWGDTWLRDTQTLYFTEKSRDGRMCITQVDGMGGEAAASVWLQLEQRNIGRDMAEEEAGEEKSLPQFDGHIGPYAITFFMDASVFTAGEKVGHYYYNDRPESVFTLKLVNNEAVNAKGSMHVVLKEFTANGNNTGTFDGQYECRGGGYEGTFTNSKGKKFHFELMEQ
ncbi:MAG: hypothetical protein IJK46_08600 [Prevotella sp.]|nr:hypothetical protein [Prevotella sp.]MBQ6728676.1 hypothetical protein [Bacteroidales bacterium]